LVRVVIECNDRPTTAATLSWVVTTVVVVVVMAVRALNVNVTITKEVFFNGKDLLRCVLPRRTSIKRETWAVRLLLGRVDAFLHRPLVEGVVAEAVVVVMVVVHRTDPSRETMSWGKNSNCRIYWVQPMVNRRQCV
jgi:hypothetical protein